MAIGVRFASAIAAVVLGFGPGQSQVEPPASIKVVVTSKSIHSLVAEVLAGIAVPTLLVDGAASPHTYAMKPSDARKVHQADLLFRVSDVLEPFTEKVVRSLPASVRVVTLAEATGVELLPRRTGATFAADAHDHGHGHVHPRVGTGGAYDPHIWLDPQNARAMATAIAKAVGAVRPEIADQARLNASGLDARLLTLTAELSAELAPVAGRPFVVFHDAYQYFEHRFGLTAVGAITASPDAQPSARRLVELRQKVQTMGATCVFSEPQFQQKVIASIAEGTKLRVGMLDPEGTTLEAGPALYATLMRKLVADMTSCLVPTAG